MNTINKKLTKEAIFNLKELIKIESFSENEDKTATFIYNYFVKKNIVIQRHKNNIWAKNKHFDNKKKTILLNSHHDTVRPNSGYTKNPFVPTIEGGKLYGLGSNDAGGCLVSQMATFIFFYEKENLNYNIIYSATAEEESSGDGGIVSLLKILPKIDFAIVGEPTEMNLAIAEKGLLVLDCKSIGTSGHAAHLNTINPIYIALKDIQFIEKYKFPLTSDFLGDVKMTTTQINAGKEHNVVPASCNFVVDIRVNEKYSNRQIFDFLKTKLKSKITARSFNLNSSSINKNHKIVKAGIKLGRKIYGSPTLSDQSRIDFESIKIGPGLSTRSHSSDEYIYIKEIEEGIDLYIKILNEIL